jgi:hypothetical protein
MTSLQTTDKGNKGRPTQREDYQVLDESRWEKVCKFKKNKEKRERRGGRDVITKTRKMKYAHAFFFFLILDISCRMIFISNKLTYL